MAIRVELSDPRSLRPLERLAQDLEHLAEDIARETLEDLPSDEAAAQITLWATQWRRLKATAPEALTRRCRQVLGLLLDTCRRYPGRLERIAVLDENNPVDLLREADRARERLGGGFIRRGRDGWKEGLLLASRELGIGPDQVRQGAERDVTGEAA
jgi:hypothetical protein